MEKYKWLVIGIVETDTGRKEKSIIVKGIANKEDAIATGLARLGTHNLVKCSMLH